MIGRLKSNASPLNRNATVLVEVALELVTVNDPLPVLVIDVVLNSMLRAALAEIVESPEITSGLVKALVVMRSTVDMANVPPLKMSDPLPLPNVAVVVLIVIVPALSVVLPP